MRYILLLSLVCFSLSAQRVVILNEDTGEKTFTKFPSRSDTVIGLSENLKLYYVLQEEKPQYDNLTQRLNRVKTFSDSIGEGNKYPYYIISYEVVNLPDTIIQQRKEIAILEKENEILMQSITDAKFKQYVSIGLGLLIYERSGNTLNARQEAIFNEMLPFCIKAYQNYINKQNLIQDLQTNPNININQNWIN